MKRMLLSLIVGVALLVVSGCSGGGSGAAGFAKEDLSLIVDGVSFRCDMDIEEAIAHLGDDYGYTEGMSCEYDGMDKTFLYDAVRFDTSPLSKGDLINGVYTEDPAVSTSKGLTVGTARDRVTAAYGEPAEDLGDLLIYRLPDEQASLCFELEADGTVWAIYLTAQSV